MDKKLYFRHYGYLQSFVINHVINGLLQDLMINISRYESGIEWAELRHDFVRTLRVIKTYMGLIENYPEFAKEESASDSIQHAPAGPLSISDYVENAKRGLEQASH